MTEDSAIRIDLHSAEVVHFTHKIRNIRRDQHDTTYPSMRMPDQNLPFGYLSTVNSRMSHPPARPDWPPFPSTDNDPVVREGLTVIVRHGGPLCAVPRRMTTRLRGYHQVSL